MNFTIGEIVGGAVPGRLYEIKTILFNNNVQYAIVSTKLERDTYYSKVPITLLKKLKKTNHPNTKVFE